MLGTPQLHGAGAGDGARREVGPPADVYALGAILYETADRPAAVPRGHGRCETLRAGHGRPSRSRPSQLPPHLPRDLETICLKCLEKEPARRYDGAAALAEDLGRYLDGHPISAQRRPRGTRRQVAPPAADPGRVVGERRGPGPHPDRRRDGRRDPDRGTSPIASGGPASSCAAPSTAPG